MDSDCFDRDSDHLLVEGQSTSEFQAPLKRSSRLKYNCISVSNKLVAIGCNTGGIYIFSRTDQKLLQIAFAEKETNSVSLVKISPHEKYVAFVSLSNVYVLDLKLETRSKAETLRSTSDLSGRMITSLLWDQTSAKLFIGDDLGNVSMMPVYSNKAKNLFSLPLEVIMKLDSAIVQLDKVGEKILVSTLTRCYLCDTTKHQYSQIGKKLRDGHFGACFLIQGTSTPMVYCARPGSRIWEVDFEGNVLNTHQFKQLLAIPPAPVIRLEEKYSSLTENSVYKGQSVAFPKLFTLRNNFLLTWTKSTVYILDPINVKVILWTSQFSGIQDICCVGKEIYIFLDSMELQCLIFYPVTSVIPLFIQRNDLASAANICIRHGNVFLHKHVRKKFGVPDLYKIYDKLVSESKSELAELIHEVIVNVEKKITNESENETSSSGRSRSGSAISGASTGSVLSGGVNNAMAETSAEEKVVRDSDLSNVQPKSDINQNLDDGCNGEIEIDNTKRERTKIRDLQNQDEGFIRQLQNDDKIDKVKETAYAENTPESINNVKDVSVKVYDDTLEIKQKVHNDTTLDEDKDEEESRIKLPFEEQNNSKNENLNTRSLESKDESMPVECSNEQVNVDLGNTKSDPQIHQEDPKPDEINQISEMQMSASPGAVATVSADIDLNVENGDDVGFLPAVGLGTRRLSLTSLSSIESGEVNFDQQAYDIGETSDQIAIPMKRKSGKKKRRRSYAVDSTEYKSEVRMTRSLSAGTMQALSSGKERALSPQGSVHSVKEEDSISIYSNDSLLEEGNTETSNPAESKDIADGIHGNKSAESVSLNSPMSNSGEFGQSEEFYRSGENSQSGEFSPGESTLARSWEKNKQSSSAPKTAFLQLKNKMQTKVTSGTKNLIRNIKEKNLLSKAKEIAENLSQGSEAYLHSGGVPFYETPDIQMSYPDLSQQLQDSQSAHQTEDIDSVDGLDKAVVDCTQLETVTAETKGKLQDIEILMKPEAVYKVLLNWVTVLNKTFQEFYIKKYWVKDDIDIGENEFPDSLNKSENVFPAKNSDRLVEIEHCQLDEAKNSRNTGKMSQGETCTGCHAIFRATSSTPGRLSNVRNPNSVTKALRNSNFCNLVDPLHLAKHEFQDVSELVQACFDTGCHGDILDFIEYTYVESSQVTEVILQTSEKVVVSESDKSEVNEPYKDGANELDKGDNYAETVNQINENATQNFEVNNRNGQSEEIDRTESLKNHSINITSVSDKDTLSEIASHPEQQKDIGYHCTEVVDSVKVPQNVNVETFSPDFQAKQLEKTENEEKAEFVQKVSYQQNSEHEDSDEMVIETIKDNDAQCQAMGFFVRSCFPYLTPLRIREESLKQKCSYHIWSALLTCMEGKATHDSEKYGIANTSVIDYLMENQAALDQGAMLLGHISSLFRSNLGSVVNVCVRCHPFVHPVDVMYMCRYHQVAMETVFKQYMLLMTMEETSAIKKQILSEVGRNLEACLVWLELLLSEDKDTSLVMNEQGCPSYMAHKVSRKNEALICQLTDHIEADNSDRLVLEMFRKYGYWVGVLKILKKSGPRSENLKLVLQLGDIDLLNGCNELGYETQTVGDWQEVLVTYQQIISEEGNQASQDGCSDWSKLITWNSLAVLLVRHVGSEEAVSLLDKHNIPEEVLSAEFYQVCLLSGMVQRQQRLVLHSMLEKVDSYLWSQRPIALTPQLHYLSTMEKRAQFAEPASTNTDLLQAMVGNMKEKTFEQSVEDPECHWGIETKINLLCPCCQIALKETVSHDDPGVLVFKCGHGYHKFCLPYKECMMCDDAIKDKNNTERNSFI